jgi:hypothetical protein
VLIGVTQQLAIRGVVLKHQKLTATHDEIAAWTGLGSALLVLWRQTRIAASVVGTLSVTIYLIGISVLHISTPSLFNLQVFERPNGSNISTQIGIPNIDNDTYKYEPSVISFLFFSRTFGPDIWGTFGASIHL